MSGSNASSSSAKPPKSASTSSLGDQLTRLAKTDAHQGVLAVLRDRQFLTVEDLLVPKLDGQHQFFLALDGVEDPHNLGALLRTADGAGVDGVILPERRSAPVTATVAKTSAGASEHIRIARVTNLVRSLEQLKQQNVWVLGLDERGTPRLHRLRLQYQLRAGPRQRGRGTCTTWSKKPATICSASPWPARSRRSTSRSPARSSCTRPCASAANNHPHRR